MSTRPLLLNLDPISPSLNPVLDLMALFQHMLIKEKELSVSRLDPVNKLDVSSGKSLVTFQYNIQIRQERYLLMLNQTVTRMI